MITGFYAGLLGLLLVALSANVIRKRGFFKVALGDDQQPGLTRAIRAHGNFAEYVPLCLLSIFLLENQAYAPAWLIHCFGLALLIARLLHAYGLNHLKENLRFRTIGMALTFTVIGLASVMLCLRYIIITVS